jgi:hypothetical protein
MKNILLVLFLSLVVTACKEIEPYHVYTFYGWSSGPNEEPYIRGLSPNMIQNGWMKNLFEIPGWADQKTIAQREKDFGAEAIIVHLPFGRNITGDFDFAGFTKSKQDPRLSLITDVDSFVSAWTEFVKFTGIKKVLFYYGYVGADSSVWAGLPEEKTRALIMENVEPILQLQKSLSAHSAKTGIIIDVLGQFVSPDNANVAIALPYIKSLGLLYGGEPWLHPASPYLDDQSFYTVFILGSTWLFDPDFDTTGGQWNTWSAPLEKIKGPVLSIGLPAFDSNWNMEPLAQYKEKILYSLKKYGHVTYANTDEYSIPTAKTLVEMAKKDGTYCISQNNVKNCCVWVGKTKTCTTSTMPTVR